MTRNRKQRKFNPDEQEQSRRKKKPKKANAKGSDCPKCGAKGSVEVMKAQDIDTFYTCQECGATKMKSTGRWM